MKAVIIDDSPLIIESLKDLLLAEHPQVDIIRTASNGSEGLQLIRATQPQLVFLDVEMPDMNGFDMLARLSQIDFQTIFITSFSKYAISAIRFNALDYLLKPIDPEQLKEAILRFELSHDSKMNQLKIEQALRNIEKDDISEQTFFLATQEGELGFKIKDIIRLEGDRNYSRLYLSSGKSILSSKNLKYFEDRLTEMGFFRCHRSHLVNRTHIDSLKGDRFQLRDGVSVSISRRQRSEAKQWMNGRKG